MIEGASLHLGAWLRNVVPRRTESLGGACPVGCRPTRPSQGPFLITERAGLEGAQFTTHSYNTYSLSIYRVPGSGV